MLGPQWSNVQARLERRIPDESDWTWVGDSEGLSRFDSWSKEKGIFCAESFDKSLDSFQQKFTQALNVLWNSEKLYTSAIAGSNSGSSFVVMSKRTLYLQQSYKIRLWSLVSCILVKAFIEDGTTITASPQLQHRRRILIFVSIWWSLFLHLRSDNCLKDQQRRESSSSRIGLCTLGRLI